jgi:hypothetical protein
VRQIKKHIGGFWVQGDVDQNGLVVRINDALLHLRAKEV